MAPPGSSARRTVKITSTDELPHDATKREQHKPHEPPIGVASAISTSPGAGAPIWLIWRLGCGRAARLPRAHGRGARDWARDHDSAEALTHDKTSAPGVGRQLHGRHAQAPWDIGYLMCFSDRQPGTWGPRRVRADELRAAFSDGWAIESITADTFEIHPMDGTTQVQAWLAAIRRN